MTLRDIIRILFRQKWIILISILTVAITTSIGLKLRTPVYESSVKILISGKKMVNAPYYADLATHIEEIVLTQSEIVKSNPVLDRVVEVTQLHKRPLNYEAAFASPFKRNRINDQAKKQEQSLAKLPPDQRAGLRKLMALNSLKKSIRVEPKKNTEIFTLILSDYHPGTAALLANIVSRSYVIFDLEQQLAELQTKYTAKHASVQQLQDQIDLVKKTLDGQPISNIDAFGPASVKIVEQAAPSFKPVGLPEKKLFLLAIALSIPLGIILAFIAEMLDQTFRCKQDLESFKDIPVLACINKRKSFTESLILDSDVTFRGKMPPRLKSYKVLSEEIHYLAKTTGKKRFLFSSIGAKKSIIHHLYNLAILLSAKLGHKVLIIEADVEKRDLKSIIPLKHDAGFCNVLEGKSSVRQAIHTIQPNLDIMLAGRPTLEPESYFDKSILKNILHQIPNDYTIVLANCADLRENQDAAVLGSFFDGLIFIVKEGDVRKQVVDRALQPLRQNQIPIIGSILDNRNFFIPTLIYNHT